MVEVPPKGAIVIYAKLWITYKNKVFSRKEIDKIIQMDTNNLSQVFSKLNKNGWLTINIDPEDARKHLYILKNPIEIIEEIGGKR